ncbi:MAG TPA: hypothetical protein VM533_17885 [Fimbriiglobus sp.]|nr:hypothetical protein [Fimbriiglobus sp.]
MLPPPPARAANRASAVGYARPAVRRSSRPACEVVVVHRQPVVDEYSSHEKKTSIYLAKVRVK